MHKSKPHIFVNVAINQWNYDSLEKLVSLLVPCDIEGINLSHLQFLTHEMAEVHNRKHHEIPLTGHNVSCSDHRKIDAEILWKELGLINNKYGKYRINMNPKLETKEDLFTYYHHPEKAVKDYTTCYMAWRSPHILANGDVVLAYLCFANSMGNINNKDLKEIWNGEEFIKFRKFIRDNKGSTPACWRCSLIYCGYKL